MNEIQKNRLIELLADQAVFGLNQEELTELYQLKKQFPELENDISFELTAAAIGLTDVNVSETLPANLRAKILVGADEFFGCNDTAQNVINFPAKAQETRAANQAETKQPFWQWLGWAVAAAACVALAVNLWLTRTRPSVEEAKTPQTVQTPETLGVPETIKTPEVVITPETAEIPESPKIPATGENNETLRNGGTARNPESGRNQEAARNPGTVKTPEIFRTPNVAKTPEIASIPQPSKPPTPELSAAQKRAQLLASAPDIVQTSWTSAKDNKRVLGDVVWSSAQQKGYLRLRDMPALDPNQETYQLWIVDEAQNDKTPVSGGIFNVNQAGEVIVPINAQLKIQKPKMFVISKERAGGVVVSKPNRFVAIAKI
jgi:anti-sigma-K factor RskA